LPEIGPRERVVFDDLAIGETVVGETLGREFLRTRAGNLECEASDYVIAVGPCCWVMPTTALGVRRASERRGPEVEVAVKTMRP
jgi:hypothetical protein